MLSTKASPPCQTLLRPNARVLIRSSRPRIQSRRGPVPPKEPKAKQSTYRIVSNATTRGPWPAVSHVAKGASNATRPNQSAADVLAVIATAPTRSLPLLPHRPTIQSQYDPLRQHLRRAPARSPYQESRSPRSFTLTSRLYFRHFTRHSPSGRQMHPTRPHPTGPVASSGHIKQRYTHCLPLPSQPPTKETRMLIITKQTGWTAHLPPPITTDTAQSGTARILSRRLLRGQIHYVSPAPSTTIIVRCPTRMSTRHPMLPRPSTSPRSNCQSCRPGSASTTSMPTFLLMSSSASSATTSSRWRRSSVSSASRSRTTAGFCTMPHLQSDIRPARMVTRMPFAQHS